jgi:hypothetical protein
VKRFVDLSGNERVITKSRRLSNSTTGYVCGLCGKDTEFTRSSQVLIQNSVMKISESDLTFTRSVEGDHIHKVVPKYLPTTKRVRVCDDPCLKDERVVKVFGDDRRIGE